MGTRQNSKKKVPNGDKRKRQKATGRRNGNKATQRKPGVSTKLLEMGGKNTLEMRKKKNGEKRKGTVG